MAYSSKRGDKSRKDTSFCDLVDVEMFKGLSDKVKKMEERLTKVEALWQNEEVKAEEFKKKNEELVKEINRKEIEMNVMSAEIVDLKNKVKEMSSEVVKHQQMLSASEINEELLKQAKNIVEKSKDFEESVDTVCTVQDEIRTTYAQILKEKEEIKKNKSNDENIRKEVKEVIRKNPKLIRETVDMNKSIIILGKKEEEINNRIVRDRKELTNIMNIINKVSTDLTEKDIEEFHRLGKYESGKHRPIKVTFQSADMMEEIMSNARNLKGEEEMKNVWIRRCLNKEDRETLKEKIDEAKQKNEARSEEEESRFFFRVVGLQVRKWYKNKREMETAERPDQQTQTTGTED